MATTLYGRIQSEHADSIQFVPGLAPEASLQIPRALVDRIQDVRRSPQDDAPPRMVSLTLKEPGTAEATLLSTYVDLLTQGLVSLAAKLGAAIEPDMRASDACLRCIKRCKQIVVTKDNPLDQIICMLNCNDCPG